MLLTNPKACEILRARTEFIGIEPEYAVFRYRNYGFGLGYWGKDLLSPDYEERTIFLEKLRSINILIGFEESNELSVKILNRLRSDRMVLHIKSMPIIETESGLVIDKTKDFIIGINGRRIQSYKIGAVFDLTLLPGAREITIHSTIEERQEEEVDTLIRLLEFIANV